MPNHVITEITFRNVTPEQQETVLSKVRGKSALVDFETLLPIPLNVWKGNVGSQHEAAFPQTALNWCRENWSTKWNAYGLEDGAIVQTEDTLTITFQTAWGTPYGWLVALYNSTELAFSYFWFDEGQSHARTGFFEPAQEDFLHEPWGEKVADKDETRRMYKKLYGKDAEE